MNVDTAIKRLGTRKPSTKTTDISGDKEAIFLGRAALIRVKMARINGRALATEPLPGESEK